MTRRRLPSNAKEASTRDRYHSRSSNLRSSVPEIYHEMLVEAFPSGFGDNDRLPKRRKVNADHTPSLPEPNAFIKDRNEDPSDNDIEFEDVLPNTGQQIIYDDSGDDSEDEGNPFEDIEIDFDRSAISADDPEHIELTLTTSVTQPKIQRNKARIFTKAERAAHLEIHKMHLLCLLRHVDQVNDWCNDESVKLALVHLVPPKVRIFFSPESQWTAFRRSESIKRGLEDTGRMWKLKFNITARGMYRPYWTENDEFLNKFQLPSDSQPPFPKEDFQVAATQLEGSRDIGAQLYCALLRGLGLEVRLVCSLQPLPLGATSKTATSKRAEPGPTHQRVGSPAIDADGDEIVTPGSKSSSAAVGFSQATAGPISVRQRLGHPNAAHYHLPKMSEFEPSPHLNIPRRKINESPYPVFWIEVLDEPHQKWIPVDPLITNSVNKARAFEPPASDGDNAMSYVVAFESEGTARDVTRRYTRWYAAKTRKTRVESTEGGERWWRKTMRFYSRGWKTQLDESEDAALAEFELREGMPVSIADFKGHPRYVLERDLKRNEVLVTKHEVGKIKVGKSKQMESVFRRRDVKAVKSADSWYRLGRNIKVGEQPIKIRPVPPRKDVEVSEEEEDIATPLYTEAQTEIYIPPPVVNGKVPRNKFGNFDVYVPSMVPQGGVHVRSPDAARAAQLLGMDYARAVTGFEFRGRRGTAVLNGVIIASEYREAMEAVLEGFLDERAQAEEDMRLARVLRTWKRFLVGLRIKQRVDGYAAEGEEMENATVDEDDGGMDSEEYEDDGGGGFFPE